MKTMLSHILALLLSIYTTAIFAQSTQPIKQSAYDPVVESIELVLDLQSSSKDLIQALSEDSIISEQSIPTMTVTIYQSGKRILTGRGYLPGNIMAQSANRNVEFMFEANLAEQKFSLHELSATQKQKIATKNPDMHAMGQAFSTGLKNTHNKNVSWLKDIEINDINFSGYTYPSTHIRISAIDPVFIILARTYLRVNGVSDGSEIIWADAYYYHWCKLADGYSWPLDTTWFRENGSIDWPSPNYWSTTGYSASTMATYGNWDWRRDDRKTNIKHDISFQVKPSGVTNFQYNHTDWGEDALFIRGTFSASTTF